MKKTDIKNMETISYYSGFGGIEIKHIEFDINVFVYYVAGAWRGRPTYHKAYIYCGNRGLYFKFKGIRIYFEDCIRCN